MAVNEDYLNYIKEQIAEFGEVEFKKFFGGAGLFHEGLLFGMIGGDVFRLKVDEYNRNDFEQKGMRPYFSNTKKIGMPYWEVPEEILEDKTELAKWADKSFQAAKRAKK